MKQGYQKICVKCDRRLIEVSNCRGVRYWEKKLEHGGRKLMDGFTQIGDNFIRINHRSLATAEVWSKAFPISKKYLRSLCPKCTPEYLKEKGIRKEG